MKETTLLSLTTTAQPMLGGVDAVAGIGQDYLFGIGGAFNTGDMITLTLTDSVTGYQTQIGAGNVTGIQFTYVKTFDDKVYGLGGKTVYFSALEQPTVWNDPNAAGNGFKTLSNYYATQSDLTAIASYQLGLLFCARNWVQIWDIDPDPSLYKRRQTLLNIGTISPRSVQSVGDMDVYMLADNGVRSVRVRDASNNAIIADVGTPIDDILQPLLASLTDAQIAAACGVIEPKSNRYWLYIPQPDGSAGLIYVFSYFSSSSIAAWGTYKPSYQQFVDAPLANYPPGNSMNYTVTPGKTYFWNKGANEKSLSDGDNVLTASGYITPQGTILTLDGNASGLPVTCTLETSIPFVPTEFIVSNGQVWARAGDLMLQYGGSDDATYDRCGVSFTTPYVDGGTPATKKQFTGIDAAMEGTWAISAAFDFNENKYKQVWAGTKPTFMGANIGWAATGTHYSFSASETGAGYARFASLMCHQQGGDPN